MARFAWIWGIGQLLHMLALASVAVFGVGAVAYTVMSAFGAAPWLTFPLSFGEITYAQAGMWLQIAITALLAAMVFFLPTSVRVSALEASHRNFHVSMDDVARAYHTAHTADRAGLFSMSSEFDQVRERLAYLRDHPDLEQLEPDVLELAAQMSQQSRHLADVYSDDKVARAKAFLRQRQQEAEAQQERIVEALHTCQQIKTWAAEVSAEEAAIAGQLEALEARLQEALPLIGYSFEPEDEDDARDTNVVALPHKPAAE